MKVALRLSAVTLASLIALLQPGSAVGDSLSIDVPPAVAVLSVAVVAADVVSLIGNTVYVAKGEGSRGMGWVGFAAGSFTVLVGLAANSDTDSGAAALGIAAGGAVVAGLGIWSIHLAGRRGNRPDSGALTIGPEFLRRTDGGLERRVAVALAL